MASEEDQVYECVLCTSCLEWQSQSVTPFILYFSLSQSQEKEARDEMKRRAKELQMARKEAGKRGGRDYNVGGGFGSLDYNPGPSVDMSTSHQPSKPAYNPPR